MALKVRPQWGADSAHLIVGSQWGAEAVQPPAPPPRRLSLLAWLVQQAYGATPSGAPVPAPPPPAPPPPAPPPPPPEGEYNVALAANGGVAYASSYYNDGTNVFPPAAVINGELLASNWTRAENGGWNDNTYGAAPDWLRIKLGTFATINRVVVYLLVNQTVAPTDDTVAQGGHITDFDLEYWDGAGWALLQQVRGNDRGRRTLTFTPVATTDIRIVVLGTADGYARIAEVQAWGVASDGVAPPGPEYVPFQFLFEEATPEQIGLYLPLDGSVSSEARMNLRYRAAGAGAWRVGHPLHRIVPGWEHNEHLYPIVDAFAGSVFDLVPGATYEVELTLVEPGYADRVYTSAATTRRLPPRAPAVTHTAAPGDNMQAKFNALQPGHHLKLAAGVYNVESLYANFGVGGARADTAAGLIYITGTTSGLDGDGNPIRGTVLKDTSGRIVQIRELHNVVFENLVFEGSGVNSGLSASSIAFGIWDGATTSYVTVRNCDFTGVDQVMRGSDQAIRGYLVYNNRCVGNNVWGPPDLATNNTWNDDGITISGYGNVAFNNSMHGFGDSFAMLANNPSCGVYFYRNLVTMTGDDAVEADYGTRNIGWYDNHTTNAGTFLSLDPIFGGPFYAFRNICINPFRGPLKINSTNTGFYVYSNTVVKTVGTTGYGWVQFNNGHLRGWGYRNNILIAQNGGEGNALLLIENGITSPVDFDHNAWFPDYRFRWQDGGYHDNLANAKQWIGPSTPVFSGVQRHVGDLIAEANPFVTPVVLGPTYATEITTTYDCVLAPGSVLRNAGVAIPGITDGFTGAAPDMGAVITGRPVPHRGYNPALDPEVPTAMPAWTFGVAVGEWVRVCDGPAGVNPSIHPAPGVNGPASRVDAYQGWVWDWVNRRGIGRAKGGHNDYGGSEELQVDLMLDSPYFYISRQSSAVPDILKGTVGFYPTHNKDGRMMASHATYTDHYRYTDNAYVRLGGYSFYSDPSTGSAKFLYRVNLDTGLEDGEGTFPNEFYAHLDLAVRGESGQGDDRSTGAIYYGANNAATVRRLNPDNTIETVCEVWGVNADWASEVPFVIDHTRKRLIVLGNAYQGGSGLEFDLNGPIGWGQYMTAFSFAGDAANRFPAYNALSARYEEALDKIVVKTNNGGEVVLVDPVAVNGVRNATVMPTTGVAVPGPQPPVTKVFAKADTMPMPDGSVWLTYLPRHSDGVFACKLKDGT